jgi:hypothetical protein
LANKKLVYKILAIVIALIFFGTSLLMLFLYAFG